MNTYSVGEIAKTSHSKKPLTFLQLFSGISRGWLLPCRWFTVCKPGNWQESEARKSQRHVLRSLHHFIVPSQQWYRPHNPVSAGLWSAKCADLSELPLILNTSSTLNTGSPWIQFLKFSVWSVDLSYYIQRKDFLSVRSQRTRQQCRVQRGHVNLMRCVNPV